MEAPKRLSERTLVFLVGAVQFVNILDFLIVMPLGPDFAANLGIPTSHIGVIGGSYTAAAAVAGLVGSFFLDRFDRRRALGVAMFGLMLATAAGGFSVGLGSLLATRIVAGIFGGPATSIALAMVTDAIPPERRGRAMGAVMGAFSAASVIGVPVALELARLFDWRAAFFAVAALSLFVVVGTLLKLPPMPSQLGPSKRPGVTEPLLDRVTVSSLAGTAAVMLGMFAIVPNLSAFVQHNLGYPREQLGLLYLVGGIASFLAMRLVGALVDRFGATPLVTAGTLLFVATSLWGFVWPGDHLPVLLFFVVFMVSSSIRNVPLQALASRVPRVTQRAEFMSAQSAVRNLASALGAVAASLMLEAEPSGRLLHMDRATIAAALLALTVPVLTAFVEHNVRRRERLSS